MIIPLNNCYCRALISVIESEDVASFAPNHFEILIFFASLQLNIKILSNSVSLEAEAAAAAAHQPHSKFHTPPRQTLSSSRNLFYDDIQQQRTELSFYENDLLFRN